MNLLITKRYLANALLMLVRPHESLKSFDNPYCAVSVPVFHQMVTVLSIRYNLNVYS